MTAIAISGMGLTGVLRLTWVHDNLAHVLEHCEADEPSGTWTGLAVVQYVGQVVVDPGQSQHAGQAQAGDGKGGHRSHLPVPGWTGPLSICGLPVGVAVCGTLEDLRGRTDLGFGRLQDGVSGRSWPGRERLA